MKNGRVYHNFKKYQEEKLVKAIDWREETGKSKEDDNWSNNHLTHVASDGARTWSC